MPIPEDIPIIIFGATMINIGIYVFAILQQPQFILSGRIVFAEIETFIVRDILNLWFEVSGFLAEYVSISLNHYDVLWFKWGCEIGLML